MRSADTTLPGCRWLSDNIRPDPDVRRETHPRGFSLNSTGIVAESSEHCSVDPASAPDRASGRWFAAGLCVRGEGAPVHPVQCWAGMALAVEAAQIGRRDRGCQAGQAVRRARRAVVAVTGRRDVRARRVAAGRRRPGQMSSSAIANSTLTLFEAENVKSNPATSNARPSPATPNRPPDSAPASTPEARRAQLARRLAAPAGRCRPRANTPATPLDRRNSPPPPPPPISRASPHCIASGHFTAQFWAPMTNLTSPSCRWI